MKVSGLRESATQDRPRLYVAWHRCEVDRQQHAVTDEAFADGVRQQTGVYDALCGRAVHPGSMLLPPAPRCLACEQLWIAHTDSIRPELRRGRRRRSVISRLVRRPRRAECQS